MIVLFKFGYDTFNETADTVGGWRGAVANIYLADILTGVAVGRVVIRGGEGGMVRFGDAKKGNGSVVIRILARCLGGGTVWELVWKSGHVVGCGCEVVDFC